MTKSGIAFLFICLTAKMAASAPLPLLGINLFPTNLLDLEESNHSDPKCVTVNGRDLCTTIANCPREAYQCSYLDATRGHSCGLNVYQCECTATYGNDNCQCDVMTHEPYLVATSVSCPQNYNEIDLSLDNADSYCSDPVGYYYPPDVAQHNETACYRGGATFSIHGLFEVNWECAHDIDSSGSVQEKAASAPEPDKECTCQAMYRYHKCSSCQPCPHDEPGSFRAVCPGFFMDCFQTYSVWETPRTSSGARASLVFWTVAFLLLTSLWGTE
mmetsp:Transcript_14704/g.29901  ORF Transcript_14704/g.29901 Transcript_14704/m.29901 type:complete len:272 (-) Transcript_14704:1614-2429(-)